MKKQWIIFIISLVVAAALCLLVSWTNGEGNPILGPTRHTRPTLELSGSTDPDRPPVVRLYACDAETVAAYESLAAQYTQQTGIECVVLTGELAALMDSETPPTIFCMHSQAEAAQWKDRLYDLAGSHVVSQLYSDSFALQLDGSMLCVAMDVTGYGIVYNASLLAQAGYTRSDITDLTTFRQVVEAITANKTRLGFSAFSMPSFTTGNFAALLCGISENPDHIRDFLDLNLANGASGNALTLFQQEKIVFYMAGGWEYDTLSQVGFHNLDILPFYTEDGEVLPCLSNCYWGVNALSGEENALAAVDFLGWLVTAGESGTPVDSLGFFAPFREATGGDTLFDRRLLRKYMQTESVTVRWSLAAGLNQSQLRLLSASLQAYADNPSDKTWESAAMLLP